MSIRWRAPLVRLVLTVPTYAPGDQDELPAPTELNYDVPLRRLPRQFRPGLTHMAGFSQHGMPQTWGSWNSLFLPPPVQLGPIQKLRNVGGAYGFGRPFSGQIHVPSVLVPKTVG